MLRASSMGGRLEPYFLKLTVHIIGMNNFILVKYRDTAEEPIRNDSFDNETV